MSYDQWKATNPGDEYLGSKPQKMKTVVMGEFMLSEPAFRTNSRIIAVKNEEGVVRFILEYQHEGEPGAWLPEPSFPWHEANFDSIICAAAEFHAAISKIIRYREKQVKEERENV